MSASFALALALTALAGCSQEARVFANGGVGGAGGAGGAHPSGTGGAPAGAGGAGGGGGGAPAIECMPGQPPYAGPLCGSPDLPCKVHEDAIVQSAPAARNDAPAVALDGACDPHFIFSISSADKEGFYAERDGMGGFVVEQTPFPIVMAGAAVVNGDVYVVANEGSPGISLYRRVQGKWDAGLKLMGEYQVTSRGVARDSAGTLHAILTDSANTGYYGRLDLAMQFPSLEQIGSIENFRVPIAVTPEGVAHLAFWRTVNSQWTLHWQALPNDAEPVMNAGSNVLEALNQLPSIAVVPGDSNSLAGTPHILVARTLKGSPGFYELVRAARMSAGAWALATVDQEDPALSKKCDELPTKAGEICNFDYETLYPVGIVASQGGDVRAIYNKVHNVGSKKSNCKLQNLCFWASDVDNSTGKLIVIGDGGASKFEIGDDIMVEGATAALDTAGRIHVAFYNGSPKVSGTVVRYIVIGQ